MDTKNRNALKVGNKLNEFEIKRILGNGGFGITYLAYDTKLQCEVVIKEYFPTDLAVRVEGSTVSPYSEDVGKYYQKGMERFLKEAQILAKFNHPNVVKVKQFFQKNSTAYFVMDYEVGEDLESYIAKKGIVLEEEELLDIIIPILDGLREIHQQGVYHRDIKPSNIYLRRNGTPMLIDFGASKQIESKGSSKVSSFNPQTPGYAAPEQETSSSSLIGAHTDIYALGATLYKCITNVLPVSAQERSLARSQLDHDPYESIHSKVKEGSYSKDLLDAIDKAMEFKIKDRPQSIKVFQDMFDIPKVKEPDEMSTQISPLKETPKKPKSQKGWWVLLGLFIITLVGGGFFIYQLNSQVLSLNEELDKRGAINSTEKEKNKEFEQRFNEEQKSNLELKEKFEKVKIKCVSEKNELNNTITTLKETLEKHKDRERYDSLEPKSIELNYRKLLKILTIEDKVIVVGIQKYDKPITVENIESGEKLQLENSSSSFFHGYRDIKVKSSPNNKILVGYDNQDLKVWNIETGKLLQTFSLNKVDGEVNKITIDDQYIYILSNQKYDDYISKLDINDSGTLEKLEWYQADYSFITNSNKKEIITTDHENIKIYKIGVSTIPLDKEIETNLNYHKAFTLSRNGNTIVVADSTTIQILDSTTGKPITSFKHYQKNINSLYLSDDQKTLFSRYANTLVLWDIPNNLELRCLRNLNVKAISSNGKTIVSMGCKEKTGSKCKGIGRIISIWRVK